MLSSVSESNFINVEFHLTALLNRCQESCWPSAFFFTSAAKSLCWIHISALLNKSRGYSNIFLVRQMVCHTGFVCRVTVFRFCHIYHTNVWQVRFTRATGKSEYPRRGVSPFKTRRKVYWAMRGNRRPNLVSLVIDNNSSFLARLRPLITTPIFKIEQAHSLISNGRSRCNSTQTAFTNVTFKLTSRSW